MRLEWSLNAAWSGPDVFGVRRVQIIVFQVLRNQPRSVADSVGTKVDSTVVGDKRGSRCSRRTR